MLLSKEEVKRYEKHLLLPEIGLEGQQKLKSAKVLVLGAGGLGCPVLMYLAAAGVGTLGIVDNDTVELSNLQRQVLYPVDAIGKKKAEVARERLRSINPTISIVAHPVRFSADNALNLVQGYDFVVDCTDNFPTRYLLNDTCIITDKPFIYGSIHRFEGQISVFNFKDAEGQEGPSYRCLFPDAPEEMPNCSEIGVIGVLPGIIGTWQAMEAIKLITGIGQILSGKLLIIDTLTHQQRVIKIRRNEKVIEETKARVGQVQLQEILSFCQAQLIPIKQVSPMELHEWLDDDADSIQLVDVREEGLLPGLEYANAIAIPLSQLADKIALVSTDKMVIVYCQSGNRSQAAAQLLTGQYGFENVYNLKGGLNEWKDLIY